MVKEGEDRMRQQPCRSSPSRAVRERQPRTPARPWLLYEGTSEIQREVIARGLDRISGAPWEASPRSDRARHKRKSRAGWASARLENGSS